MLLENRHENSETDGDLEHAIKVLKNIYGEGADEKSYEDLMRTKPVITIPPSRVITLRKTEVSTAHSTSRIFVSLVTLFWWFALFRLLGRFIPIENLRIIRLEECFKFTKSNHHPDNHQTTCLSATSTHLLDTSGGVDSSTALGSPFQ